MQQRQKRKQLQNTSLKALPIFWVKVSFLDRHKSKNTRGYLAKNWQNEYMQYIYAIYVTGPTYKTIEYSFSHIH